eukprot:GFYU01017074.1.p1 GENE.GFYU01017074.1~~GFYU01017074.1.p1  ORF type:complete len:214 (+),score=33.63 GFYU01017074.1:25-666(+)
MSSTSVAPRQARARSGLNRSIEKNAPAPGRHEMEVLPSQGLHSHPHHRHNVSTDHQTVGRLARGNSTVDLKKVSHADHVSYEPPKRDNSRLSRRAERQPQPSWTGDGYQCTISLGRPRIDPMNMSVQHTTYTEPKHMKTTSYSPRRSIIRDQRNSTYSSSHTGDQFRTSRTKAYRETPSAGFSTLDAPKYQQGGDNYVYTEALIRYMRDMKGK